MYLYIGSDATAFAIDDRRMLVANYDTGEVVELALSREFDARLLLGRAV